MHPSNPHSTRAAHPSQRPASSASISSSSQPQRPSSSLSQQRPASSHSQTQRPPSSTSYRPTSRISQRSHSRVSNYRPPTSLSLRQSPRIPPLVQALVAQVTQQVTGLSPESEDDGDGGGEDNYRTTVDFVSKNLEYTAKGGASQDMSAMDKQFHGHVQKARINSNDELAEALRKSYIHIKSKATQSSDLDQEIKVSHLPDHLQLLILLSNQPTPQTHTYASLYLSNLTNPDNNPTQKYLTWADILAEEPFEGEHWEGILGDVNVGSGGSTPSLSPMDDDDLDEDDISSPDSDLGYGLSPQPPVRSTHASTGLGMWRENQLRDRTYEHRKDVEEMQARQYWRPEWRTDVVLTKAFNLGDASTLGPSLRYALGEHATLSIVSPDNERYIHEHDAVREVLMALQGRENLIMTWSDQQSSFIPTPTAPRLVHLTLSSQASIMASFMQTATVLQRLRKFVSAVYMKASEPPPLDSSNAASRRLVHKKKTRTRTLEASADAIDREIQNFDKWCASKEEEICRAQAGSGPPLIISLLSLEKAIRDAFAVSFSVILDVLQTVMTGVSRSSHSHTPAKEVWALPSLPTRIPPAAITALLLDTLLQAVQEYLSMVDMITSDALMRVFAKTAEPVWSMVAQWLEQGMPIRDSSARFGEVSLDDEFFIEDNEVILVDPDFWADGYDLRDGTEVEAGKMDGGEEMTNSKTIPIFLAHVARAVLGSGKATGLLRALGIPPSTDTDHGRLFLNQSFSDLLVLHTGRPTHTGNDSTVSLSTDTLSRVVYDELLPHCEATGKLLTTVLVDDCDLWRHLSAIEDLYLMRRGDSMSHFTDILFAKMDGQQPWSDFHFLNSAFGDVLDVGSTRWIESSLVRLSYRGNSDRAISHTVKSIDGLLVEYAVPFPLTYIFGPRVLQAYGSLFVFLLQIRRAKSILERILVRGAIASVPHLGTKLKVFYAMRSKLSWFVNTLLSFLTTYVLHTQLLKFHDAFREATSLDEMIALHNDHVEKVQNCCLLKSNTSALHRAIVSILDMCLHFSEFFVAFAGDTTTHDISRQYITASQHRSRRQRRQRKNIIGFSQSLVDTENTSSEDSELEEDDFGLGDATGPSYSVGPSASSTDFLDRIDKMTSELDGLVRFVRRGTETLAGGTGDAAPAFGVLALTLEDWDS